MSHTASSKIPMLDMSADIEEHWDEYQDAFSRVMKSGQFIRGPEVAAFEKEVSTYLGCKHAIGVNSGTDALVIGLRAMGITTGDEVITTPFTFAATPESICLAGATPVFVDIEPDTFNINPDLIDAAITPKTKAIMPVHLFGLPANMPRITEIAKKHHLKIIEDTAQAFGSESMGKKAGTIGDVGAYSFFPSK
ncbi:MAG: aminotransferase class I/II-fold pyridoxal phosphate-dependent enzyme, partial [Planctomycetaceae bacterium]|nr:aminotransferase class I/II-fold pyridoxal phosphate-dependent enzyme [Planctomycetaceae bacterium]